MNASLSSIADLIKTLLLARHVGKPNAIKRADLLGLLIRMGNDDLTDRQMRKAVEGYCPKVCSFAGGYYWPSVIGERESAIAYQLKKVRGLRRRCDAIADGFPELEAMVQREFDFAEART